MHHRDLNCDEISVADFAISRLSLDFQNHWSDLKIACGGLPLDLNHWTKQFASVLWLSNYSR